MALGILWGLLKESMINENCDKNVHLITCVFIPDVVGKGYLSSNGHKV